MHPMPDNLQATNWKSSPWAAELEAALAAEYAEGWRGVYGKQARDRLGASEARIKIGILLRAIDRAGLRLIKFTEKPRQPFVVEDEPHGMTDEDRLRKILLAIALECDPGDHEWHHPVSARRYLWNLIAREFGGDESLRKAIDNAAR